MKITQGGRATPWPWTSGTTDVPRRLEEAVGAWREPPRRYEGTSTLALSPCDVFSQKEGVTTSCHAAFTAAIDIMIQ